MEALFEILDDVTPAKPIPPVIGRSELERWQSCPQQAAQVEGGHVSTGSIPATIGNEVHRILGEACKFRRVEAYTAFDLRQWITSEAAKSRPDVQPDVIDAIRYSVWKFVEILTTRPDSGEERHPEDIMRFDSGDGDMSGQLSADLVMSEDVTIRVTGELDVLIATISPDELDLWDTKSGHAHHTATSVKSSFQFQVYCWLIWRNYPKCQRVTVRVFMSMKNQITSAVSFDRSEYFNIEQRIKSSVEAYLKYKGMKLEDVPAWPELKKCTICDAVMVCPKAFEPMATDPEQALRQLIVLQAKATRIKALLTIKVREDGELVYGAGTRDSVAFGTGKPKKARAAICAVYKPSAMDETEEDEP